jgi:hypothetical protein
VSFAVTDQYHAHPFRQDHHVVRLKSGRKAGMILAVLATTAFGATQKMICRDTGKTMDTCCCEMKDGKFYWKLTKKTYGQCCCDMK